MIGVTVRVKGSKTAAVTDMDGKFSIAAGAGASLKCHTLAMQHRLSAPATLS